MFVSEIMSTCIAECTEDTKLEDVYELIRKCDHGMVVVVDSLAHRVPIGVVTERSICEQIISRGRNPRSLSAGSVMDSRIKKVRNSELLENIQSTLQGDDSAIIAVDENRRVAGLVSKEKVKRAVRVARRVYQPAVPVTAAAQAPLHRISEIPAFGWMS
ncbi:MAG TPA: CBS domain-containing protein [Pyrinomonadaceae bacterium]|nr:CBS domain-containing protein [Pyrinomonadaceae bacterium]